MLSFAYIMVKGSNALTQSFYAYQPHKSGYNFFGYFLIRNLLFQAEKKIVPYKTPWKDNYAHLLKSLWIDKKSIEGSFLNLRAQSKVTIRGAGVEGQESKKSQIWDPWLKAKNFCKIEGSYKSVRYLLKKQRYLTLLWDHRCLKHEAFTCGGELPYKDKYYKQKKFKVLYGTVEREHIKKVLYGVVEWEPHSSFKCWDMCFQP